MSTTLVGFKNLFIFAFVYEIQQAIFEKNNRQHDMLFCLYIRMKELFLTIKN